MHGRKGYNYAVQFDGDGQHRPEYIKSMKEKMDEGYDIVIGSRFVTEKKKLVHEDAWKPADRNGDLADYRSKDRSPTSGMRLFSRKMIGSLPGI